MNENDVKREKIVFGIISFLLGLYFFIGRYFILNKSDLLEPLFLWDTFLLNLNAFGWLFPLGFGIVSLVKEKEKRWLAIIGIISALIVGIEIILIEAF